jgi:hypothetical protein
MKSYILVFILSAVLFLGFAPEVFANQVPVANAGPDLYINSNQTITLQGSGHDPDGGSVNFYWNCSGGTLSSYNIAQPIFTATNSSSQNSYTCTLSITDNYGLSSSDSMTIFQNYNTNNVGGISVQTNQATNISGNQATLNGSFTAANISVNYVWFQYGFSTNYGTETVYQSMSGNSGSFTQIISSLYLNGTYHYRAVVQDYNGNKFYGQDLTFTANQNYYNTGTLSISKKAINITKNNLTWSNLINACPSDILSFSVVLQANGGDLHNVVVKENLPANLIYNDTLLIGANRDYSSNPSIGINVGTIKAGEITIISYQVRVAPSANFTFGTSTLTSETIVSSNETGSQTTSNSIVIDNTQVSGANTTNPTVISTGMTNKFFTESFFLPMLLIIIGSWLYFSGRVYTFADWLGTKM